MRLLPKVITLAALVTAIRADAALVHRYSFTADASDSVGGAHGTLIDSGDSVNGAFTSGQLDLSANTGELSRNPAQDAYIDFPNGIVTSAYESGVPGKLTIELWAQSSVNYNWASLFTAGGVNSPLANYEGQTYGHEADYIQFIPQAPDFSGAQLRVTTHRSFFTGPYVEKYVDRAGALSTAEPTHIMAVVDTTQYRPIPRPAYRGDLTVYVNGVSAGSVQLDTSFQIVDMVDNNIWIGRSQHSDAMFRGWVDELRIYNAALTAADAARHYALGADIVPEPSSVMLTSLAATLYALAEQRRRRPLDVCDAV